MQPLESFFGKKTTNSSKPNTVPITIKNSSDKLIKTTVTNNTNTKNDIITKPVNKTAHPASNISKKINILPKPPIKPAADSLSKSSTDLLKQLALDSPFDIKPNTKNDQPDLMIIGDSKPKDKHNAGFILVNKKLEIHDTVMVVGQSRYKGYYATVISVYKDNTANVLIEATGRNVTCPIDNLKYMLYNL
jgi:hypothetical protein